jgi:hypothetical protein
MEKIVVIDNFLNQNELQTALGIIQNLRWTFGHISNGKNSNETPFWMSMLNDEPFFVDHVFNLIQKTFNKKFSIERVYANGQSFGQDGTYHTDSDLETCYTFVLYLSDIHKTDVEVAGGHIYFKLPDIKYKICYEPILNRSIFFPSTYIHKACSFSRYIMNLRTSVAFKLKEI